jgi:hypothetical protein
MSGDEQGGRSGLAPEIDDAVGPRELVFGAEYAESVRRGRAA